MVVSAKERRLVLGCWCCSREEDGDVVSAKDENAPKDRLAVRGVITCAGTLSRKGLRRQSRHVELTRVRLVREGAMLQVEWDVSNGRSNGRRLEGCAIGTRTEAISCTRNWQIERAAN